MKYHDNSTYASNAIEIEIDVEKLTFLAPFIANKYQRLKYRFKHWGLSSNVERIAEHIKCGDSQGAVVIKTSPLLIAAYNSDIDCIVMLKFERKIQQKYQFKIRDKLVCVNTFGQAPAMQSDLIPGRNNFGMWTMVHPIVAQLVSSSEDALEKRMNEIGDEGYDYIWKLGNEYLFLKKGVYREGKPYYAAQAL